VTDGPGAGAVAVSLAAVAGAVLPGHRDVVLRRVAATRGGGAARPVAVPWWAPVPAVAAAVGWWSGSVLLAAAAGVAVLAAGRARSARAARRRSARRRAAALELVTTLAAELRGGAEPRSALAAAAAAAHPAVAAAARSPAADVTGALAAVDEDVGLLSDLAAAWRVVELTGAPLAGPAARLAAAARADEAVRREVAAQLAGPRATALLLAVLPVSGILLGTGLGADPVGFLLTTPPGRVCLLVGTLLVAAGVSWTEAIAARAESP
jgi:tight adherence protein B